jgi:carbon monoxide dehydrogenase subunit G
MEIDKTLVLPAPPERVWALLLDPQAMGGCVPGMESVQVLNDDEYAAVMKVKVSFVSARFKLRTRIVERDAPRYLRAEGTGEDSAVASSLKQVSEMWLDGSTDGSSTTLRLKVQVDVLGRIGSFGLAAMKTKADRLWDEFGVNLAARLAPATEPPATAAPPIQADMLDSAPATPFSSADATLAESATAPAMDSTLHAPILVHGLPARTRTGFWQRLFGGTPGPIRVELRRGDTHLVVNFPVEAADACMAWLRTLSEPPR